MTYYFMPSPPYRQTTSTPTSSKLCVEVTPLLIKYAVTNEVRQYLSPTQHESFINWVGTASLNCMYVTWHQLTKYFKNLTSKLIMLIASIANIRTSHCEEVPANPVAGMESPVSFPIRNLRQRFNNEQWAHDLVAKPTIVPILYTVGCIAVSCDLAYTTFLHVFILRTSLMAHLAMGWSCVKVLSMYFFSSNSASSKCHRENSVPVVPRQDIGQAC